MNRNEMVRQRLIDRFGNELDVDAVMDEMWKSVSGDREQGYLFVRAKLIAMEKLGQQRRAERIERTMTEDVRSLDADLIDFRLSDLLRVKCELSPSDQMLVTARFVRGLSCARVAVRTGLPTEEVRSRITEIGVRVKAML